MTTTFQPLPRTERNRLQAALKGNADTDLAILLGADTSFQDTSDQLPADERVISAIRSVPSHY